MIAASTGSKQRSSNHRIILFRVTRPSRTGRSVECGEIVHSITIETNPLPPILSSHMTEVQNSTSSNGAAVIAPHPSTAENNSQTGRGGSGGASGAITVTAGSGGPAHSGSQSPTTSTPGQSSSGRSPKKRRKVNHGMNI